MPSQRPPAAVRARLRPVRRPGGRPGPGDTSGALPHNQRAAADRGLDRAGVPPRRRRVPQQAHQSRWCVSTCVTMYGNRGLSQTRLGGLLVGCPPQIDYRVCVLLPSTHPQASVIYQSVSRRLRARVSGEVGFPLSRALCGNRRDGMDVFLSLRCGSVAKTRVVLSRHRLAQVS